MPVLISTLLLLAAIGVRSQANDDYYGPQTFQQTQLFRPAPEPSAQRRYDGGQANDWRQGASNNQWEQQQGGPSQWGKGPAQPTPDWALDNADKKVAILHHKQALTQDGSFKYEYAADNGLAAGETIAPDGSRVGAYQYKDPSGQVVTLKYRAGKNGFQILEGNHLPKAPEPLPIPQQEGPRPSWSGWPYQQQQQSWNRWSENRGQEDNRGQWNAQGQAQEAAGAKQGWGSAAQGQQQQQWAYQQPQQGLDKPEPGEDGDNGEYREDRDGGRSPLAGSWDGSRAQRDEDLRSQGPHSFGDGYAFEFKG